MLEVLDVDLLHIILRSDHPGFQALARESRPTVKRLQIGGRVHGKH